jgi:hypothetical protein
LDLLILKHAISLTVQVMPSRVADINFSAPSRQQQTRKRQLRKSSATCTSLTEIQQQDRLKALALVKPDAIIFSVLDKDRHDSDTDSADEDNTLPLTVPCLIDSLDTIVTFNTCVQQM